MRIFDSFNISASALTAERLKLDIIANNLANINTTRTPGGGPYRAKEAVFRERLREAVEGQKFRGYGVRVAGIIEDKSPGRLVYDPDHPDADGRGFVTYPNINVVKEMTSMIAATRSYEANVTVLEAAKDMAMRALQIGRE